LAVAGATLVAVAAAGQQAPPPLPATAALQPDPTPTTQEPATGQAEPGRDTEGPVMDRSKPVSVAIPAIGVRSSLLTLGTRDDGSVEVPPEEQDSRAGWYEESPTPGEVGPSIILGHVDSAEYGPAVFYELTTLSEGDKVSVDRADGTTAVFRVDRTVRYPKNHFPTLEVYGNLDHAGLRLITCGGEFDFSQRSYEDNIVTYATLISHHSTE
ncbi:MAG: class F sortase, partial [Pseudonocardiaceae bacterium]